MVGIFTLLGFPAQNPSHELYQPPITSLIEKNGATLDSATSSPTSPSEEDAAPSPKPMTETSEDPPTEPEQEVAATPENSGAQTSLSNTELNVSARAALVNIFCTNTGESSLSATGSGVVVDPRGVILTNAHLAQFFLLEEPGFVNCRIRTGEPAKDAYDAELLYISPLWIQEHADTITESEPLGTGEHDFALLRITKSITSVELPDPFPYVIPNIGESAVQDGADVFIAGYPAGFLGGQVIHRELYPSSTETSIVRLFTFNNYTIDVFSLAGNILAQRGSSGAGVLDAQTGHLLGIVVTSSVEESTADRTLNAITLAHINRSILQDLGTSLPEYLSADLQTRATTFQNTIAPALRELLLLEIDQ